MSKQYRYELGDLVLCKYDFEHLYYPAYLQDTHDSLFFVGVVVLVREYDVIFFDRDILYEVLCTDGIRRRFASWEIEVLRKGKES